MSNSSYTTQVIEVHYGNYTVGGSGTDGTWYYVVDGSLDSNQPNQPNQCPELEISQRTLIYFVSGSTSLTFDTAGPVSWAPGTTPLPAPPQLECLTPYCLKIVDQNVQYGNFGFRLNMYVDIGGGQKVAIQSPDPIIVNKPSTGQ